MKTNPKTVIIGHAHFDLKLLRDIVANLPEGNVTITCRPCQRHPKGYRTEAKEATGIDVIYPNGRFNLKAGSHVSYYITDNGKIKRSNFLKFTNVIDDQVPLPPPDKYHDFTYLGKHPSLTGRTSISLLAVPLPLKGKVINTIAQLNS